MTTIRIHEVVVLPLDVETTYDFLTSPPAYETFTGHGPIPGIDRLEWHEGDSRKAGSRATVHSKDGSTHTERVVLADRPTLYAVEISEFSSAFRFLTKGASERWGMMPAPGGTKLDRTFEFELRSPLLWPIGAALGSMFRKAVRKNHENFLLYLAEHATEVREASEAANA